MIPKIIHYCWFGKKPLTEEAKKCIESWKKYCPDFEIIEWNESNYDITKNKYMESAYKEKKWAFVSDYARVDIIYQYGGIYLDTDVELISSIDDLLSVEMFCGWESRDVLLDKKNIPYENSVAFGLGFGSVKGHEVLKGILELYENLNFYNEDGTMNLVASPKYQTEVLKNWKLDDSKRTYQELEGVRVYPEDWFCPKSSMTGKITITDNTRSIHHFSMSWTDKTEQSIQNFEWKLAEIVGYSIAEKITKFILIPYKVKKKISEKVVDKIIK